MPAAAGAEVLHLHRELGQERERARARGLDMRYGERGGGESCSGTPRRRRCGRPGGPRRSTTAFDSGGAAGCYMRLADCRYAEVAELMLKPEERGGAKPSSGRRGHRAEHVAAEVRWIGEPPAEQERPAKEGEGRSRRRQRGSRSRRRRHIAGQRTRLRSSDAAGKTRARPIDLGGHSRHSGG